MNKSRHLKNSKWVESAQSQPQLGCKGVGKKAWLRQLQVWAKANYRPGSCLLPNFHWQYNKGGHCFKKIYSNAPTFYSKNQRETTAASSASNNTIVQRVIPSYSFEQVEQSWTGVTGQSGRSAWAVPQVHTWRVEWFKPPVCYSLMVPVGRLLLHSL